MIDEATTEALDYPVNEHGGITQLGKFEGETRLCPYFYELSMNGDGEHEYSDHEIDPELLYVEFDVTAEDRAAAEKLGCADRLVNCGKVRLYESSTGFCSLEFVGMEESNHAV